MMPKAEWQKGMTAWDNIRKQAEIDLELAAVVMEALQKKIDELTKQEVKEDGK